MRYFLEIAYDGTNYSGWQIQPNARSVQYEIEQALGYIVKHKIPTVGCGRTDAGVHASQFFLHFDTDFDLQNSHINQLDLIMPNDIKVKALMPAKPNAHARFDATKRAYVYTIELEKKLFAENTSYRFYAKNFNLEKMIEASKVLYEYSQFKTFAKTGGQQHTYNCEIYRSQWKIEECRWEYYVSANRFLRGMVRRIVGALLNVGKGTLTIDELRSALSTQNLLKINTAVPAQGLSLTEVHYNWSEILAASNS